MAWWFSAAAKRERLAGKLSPGPLRDFVLAAVPAPETPVADLRLLAIDLETTGLDPASDRLLSVGFVEVDGDEVVVGSARHVVIRQDQEGSVGDSATIHGLTDDALGQGRSEQEAVTTTLAALAGRVLLAHHADVEVGFLSAACRRLWGAEPLFEVVDTMQLQYRLLSRERDTDPPRGALRLWGACDQYNLPRHAAHNALSDALSCAELYLAQVQQPGAGGTLKSLRP
ncbi:exonuclease domain-containing protein [Aestuariimicrobium ganziense]|uniref:exonuclease domain-containing protein n=1 Tax=Aestuariimicrobium ganziense TaxID=2773677 RepID=UPI0019416EF7|nr:exonuclease domain-containing protein [Aestuariimicrobium ganziense]